MLERFEICAPVMVLIPTAPNLRSMSALVNCNPRERDGWHWSVLKGYRSPAYLVRLGKPSLGKTRRRGVRCLTYRAQVAGRALAFASLSKREEAALKVRKAGQAIRCMVLCRNRFPASEVGNQICLITLRLDCRWIR